MTIMKHQSNLAVAIVVALCVPFSAAFVVTTPLQQAAHYQPLTTSHQPKHHQQHQPTHVPSQLFATTDLVSTAATSSSSLWTYFWTTVIDTSVPAVLTLLVVGLSVLLLRRGNNSNKADSIIAEQSPASILYQDLYGDQQQQQQQQPNRRNGLMAILFGNNNKNDNDTKLRLNLGIPALQYLSVTHLNRKYDSYLYSMTAATRTKAQAAADYRKTSWQGTLLATLDTTVLEKLQTLEQQVLQRAKVLLEQLQSEQLLLTQRVLDQQLHCMGVNTTTSTKDSTTPYISKETVNATLSKTSAIQKKIDGLELNFCSDVVALAGPSQATVVRQLLLGNLAVRGSGSLLRDLQERPLTRLLHNNSSTTTTVPGKVFVTRFPGDATASQVANLREEVTAICAAAQRGMDEAVVILQTGGGTVTGYGLAAAQLLRLREAGLKLTVAVEQVAASGGYMMCCVADRIVASPFAVLGSIGVITDIPNVYERLKQEGVEFQTVTAGKFKRTLTPTKKPTREDFEKTKSDVEDIFRLFRDFVKENRPQLDIDAVATGETWFGTAALERNLCDEIKTADDVLLEFVKGGHDVYQVEYKPPVETPFGKLVPASASGQGDTEPRGLVGGAVRWLVRTIATEIKSELASLDVTRNKPVEERYMMMDDTADRIHAQD